MIFHPTVLPHTYLSMQSLFLCDPVFGFGSQKALGNRFDTWTRISWCPKGRRNIDGGGQERRFDDSTRHGGFLVNSRSIVFLIIIYQWHFVCSVATVNVTRRRPCYLWLPKGEDMEREFSIDCPAGTCNIRHRNRPVIASLKIK